MRKEQGHFGPCISLRHCICYSCNRILFFVTDFVWKIYTVVETQDFRLYFADGMAACVGMQGEMGLSEGVL